MFESNNVTYMINIGTPEEIAATRRSPTYILIMQFTYIGTYIYIHIYTKLASKQ
jgi:hypothetical protein